MNNGLGAVPPMAYSTWNVFETRANESIVLDIAKALKDTGLQVEAL